MIGYIVGGVVAGVSAVAASGACYRMASGVVRGAGRLVEGKPGEALAEIAAGVTEPLHVAGTQFVGLAVNAADVVAYTGLRVAALVSADARRVADGAAGFDMLSLRLAMGAILPDTSEAGPRIAKSA